MEVIIYKIQCVPFVERIDPIHIVKRGSVVLQASLHKLHLELTESSRRDNSY